MADLREKRVARRVEEELADLPPIVRAVVERVKSTGLIEVSGYKYKVNEVRIFKERGTIAGYNTVDVEVRGDGIVYSDPLSKAVKVKVVVKNGYALGYADVGDGVGFIIYS